VNAMPDDASVQAAMYGPLVLFGKLGTEGLTKDTLRAEPTPIREVPRYRTKASPAPEFKTKSQDFRECIEPVSGRALEFHTVGQAQNVTLVPFYKIGDERYGVYWKVGRT
jgi:uncharacterized protein